MIFPHATAQHFELIGELGRAEVRNGRRYLCNVVTINDTTFQQTRGYEWLPAPDVTLIKPKAGETIIEIQPVLYFGD